MTKNQGHKRRIPVLQGVVIAIVIALAAWLFLPQILSGIGFSSQPKVDATASESLRQLSELEVAESGTYGQAPPYSRDQFGQGWADLDGDNCNTRNEILRRDLDNVTYRAHTSDCVVETGTLEDPYTGEVIEFVRGEKTSEAVQIDHVVALGDAWRAGAWQWDLDQRLAFANDPLNLLAVDGPANQDKGASTADRWLPPDKNYACEYAARQVAVKYKWALQITAAELTTLNEVLRNCPDLTLVD